MRVCCAKFPLAWRHATATDCQMSLAAVVSRQARIYRRPHDAARIPTDPVRCSCERPSPMRRRERMSATARRKRNRNDPRHDATRNALLDTAEAMFAESGISAVSLRQIGIAIGSANANVVGYYFGDKEALIE